MIIPSNDRKRTVEYFYHKEDENWHRNVHKRGGTIEENVQNTLDTISPDSVMHEVWWGDTLAGFFVKYKDAKIEAIEGFHIGKPFRNKRFIEHFWEELKSYFDEPIFIGLSVQNIAAIAHCQRQGFELFDTITIESNVSEEQKKFVVLYHKNKNKCLATCIK